ncbi:protein kinase [Alteromonas sp. MMG017]|uniref:bifunctional protein-serine/threonine kinase/phosphatase n=1 Tax=Alteromonas sp. MMG017 TaxID=2822692 RepID=UPI001B3A3085|nr:bifunctional protein-serine/threonine kinase/phosphatase [Alteromonas sp. MMG017]MBQ4828264.1 protein kinase [Alteromonas sp. MMG017]
MQIQSLSLHYSECSSAGVKPINQDACDAFIPANTSPALTLKGAAFALADGISSSTVSQIASDLAIKDFIKQYFCTPETWGVAQSAKTVIQSINATLYTKTQQSPFCYTPDKGYVCTFSAVIVKGDTAHIFHVGDARVCLYSDETLQVLTQSHRVNHSKHESYLANALGVHANVDIDYLTVPLKAGDTLILMTDGVYEYVSSLTLASLISTVHAPENDASVRNSSIQNSSSVKKSDTPLAQRLVDMALENESDDNVSCQCITVASVGDGKFVTPEYAVDETSLPIIKQLNVGETVDGYRIDRQLYQSARSHVFLAWDENTKTHVVIKIPSTELAQNGEYLEHFALEEWLARRIKSNHVINVPARTQPPSCMYSISEYIEGQNLTQWLTDNPKPDVEKVRSIIEQVAKGLMAMHREGLLHQDIRPENIMIEASGNCKIIDLGSARVAGISDALFEHESDIMGTAAYVAPEYFLGDSGCDQSDLYSLAVLTYYLLSNRFPYGTQVAKTRTVAAQHKLKYQSVLDDRRPIPAWIDDTLKRALQPNPEKRFTSLSEFTYHLRHPSPAFLNRVTAPLIQRHPLKFWQGLSLLLVISNVVTFLLLYGSH